MAYLARGLAQPGEIVKKLNFVQRFISNDIVKWRYSFKTDWSGDPAIFFWVTLTDDASKPPRLRQVTTDFTNIINQKVDPLGSWGLIPYFTFRSKSEQARLKDEAFE